MADRKVTIAVETTGDTKALDDASKKLDTLGKAADDTGKKNKGAADNTQKMGQAAGRAAELTGSLSGAMAQGGPAAQQMGAGLRVLNAVIQGSTGGLMGMATLIIGAGVSAWVAYHNKVEAAKKKLEDFAAQIEKNKAAADTAGVDRLAGQYDVLRNSIDEASAASERLSIAQASADNAEKAARMADITLREKQARNGLKTGDEVGAAKIAAQFSGERRDLESEYGVRGAEREAASKARALSDSESKSRIAAADVQSTQQALGEMAGRIRAVNEQLADLYGAGAPTKQVIDPMSAGGFGGAVKYNTVVNEAEQAKQAAALRGQASGLDANYQKIAEAIAAALERQAKEAVEVQARRIEAEAAVNAYDTVRDMNPRINAADAAADARNVRDVTASANSALFRGRLDKTVDAARNNYDVRQREASMIDPSDFKRVGGRAYQEATRIDKDRDKQAAEAKRLLEAAEAAKKQIEAMDPAALTKVFTSLTRQFDRMDKAIKDMDERAKRP